jgi:hypothetical protein
MSTHLLVLVLVLVLVPAVADRPVHMWMTQLQ